MLELFDRQRQRVKILQNACGVTESRPINALWHLTFSLPYDDPKNDFCQPFWYVRYDGGELYRILPREGVVEDTGLITYTCEHVLATLIDRIMFGWRQIGNIGTYTADVINYLLSQQIERNWVLAECDFARQFEYGWEQENLLAALFSVPQPFAETYIWRTDTSVYPWRISLKRLDENQPPQLYIRRAKTCCVSGRCRIRKTSVPGFTRLDTERASTNWVSPTSMMACHTWKAARKSCPNTASSNVRGSIGGMKTLKASRRPLGQCWRPCRSPALSMRLTSRNSQGEIWTARKLARS